MAELLLLKIVLEDNDVTDAGRLCEQLSEHGVGTVKQFAALTEERLLEWGINDYNVSVKALRHAQELMHSPQPDVAKQQFLVRVRMHYMPIDQLREIKSVKSFRLSSARAGKGIPVFAMRCKILAVPT